MDSNRKVIKNKKDSSKKVPKRINDKLDDILANVLHSPVPYIEGNKTDVFNALKHRWIKCENVSEVCGLIDAVSMVEEKATKGFTIALLYRYTPTDVVKFPDIQKKCELQRLALESEVWIMLTYTNTGRVCSEIRVKSHKWNELGGLCKHLILKLDELIDLYLYERPSFAHKFIGQNKNGLEGDYNSDYAEYIPDDDFVEPIVEISLKKWSKLKIEAILTDDSINRKSYTWQEWLATAKIAFGKNKDGIFRENKLPKDVKWEFYGNTEDQKEIFLKGYISTIKGKGNVRYNVNNEVIISTKSTNVITNFVEPPPPSSQNVLNISISTEMNLNKNNINNGSWVQEILPDEDGYLFYPSNVDQDLLKDVMEYITQEDTEDEKVEGSRKKEPLFKEVYSSDRLMVKLNPNSKIRITSIDGRKLDTPKIISAGKITPETILTIDKNESFNKNIIPINAEIMFLSDNTTLSNVKIEAATIYTYILSIGSTETIKVEDYGLIVDNYEGLRQELFKLKSKQNKSKIEELRLVFLNNLKTHNYILSKEFIEDHEWRLIDDVKINVSQNDKLKLVYTRFNMKLQIKVNASQIVSLNTFFSWNKNNSSIHHDDPRQYRDVELIGLPFLPVLDILTGFYDFSEGLFKVAKTVVSELDIKEGYKKGRGGWGDVWRRRIRNIKDKGRRKLLRITRKAKNSNEAAKMIIDKRLKDVAKNSDVVEARSQLQEFSFNELKMIPKPILLDLLSFNGIFTEAQRRLIFFNGLVTRNELKEYKVKVSEGNVDSAFKGLVDNILNNFDKNEVDLDVSVKKRDVLFKGKGDLIIEIGDNLNGKNNNVQNIGIVITGTVALALGTAAAALVGGTLSVLGGGLGASTPLVSALVKSYQKGSGGFGDRWRQKFRSAKRWIKKAYLRKISKKSKKEINAILTKDLLKRVQNMDPVAAQFEIRTLSGKELVRLPKGKTKNGDSDILKSLIRNNLLSISQVDQIQSFSPTRIKDSWLTGTIYDDNYVQYLQKLSKRQLLAMHPEIIVRFLRSGIFTPKQVKWMLKKNVNIITKRDLRGTRYKFKKIKKEEDLEDVSDAAIEDFGIDPDNVSVNPEKAIEEIRKLAAEELSDLSKSELKNLVKRGVLSKKQILYIIKNRLLKRSTIAASKYKSLLSNSLISASIPIYSYEPHTSIYSEYKNHFNLYIPLCYTTNGTRFNHSILPIGPNVLNWYN